MAALLSVVETPAYLGKASKMMSEEERASVVDTIAATPRIGVLIRGTGGQRSRLIAVANALLDDFGGSK